MGGGHVLDHKNVPGKTFGGVGEFSRDLVSECAKVMGRLLGGVFVGEDYGEVDVAGAGEVVALGFQASEDVAVGVSWRIFFRPFRAWLDFSPPTACAPSTSS